MGIVKPHAVTYFVLESAAGQSEMEVVLYDGKTMFVSPFSP